jgi:hypothetical protein
MWTRLIAGATAHDINNLAQSLFNLLALAGNPNVPSDALVRYGQLAREGLKDLQRVSADLRALAHCQRDTRAQRIDLVCADVLAETEVPADRTITVGAMTPKALVRGNGAALRIAIQAPLRYCLAAGPPGSEVHLAVGVARKRVVVEVEARGATTALGVDPKPLGTILTGPEPELKGDFGLVLSGAVAREYGGDLLVSQGSVGGLAFKIQFGRAEEGAVDARSTEGAAPGRRRGRRRASARDLA